MLACVLPIGHTLIRGQANLLLLALLAGALAGVLRGQRFRGGLCLAGAMCLKIFPAFLLLFPLWRRDGRFRVKSWNDRRRQERKKKGMRRNGTRRNADQADFHRSDRR